MKKLILILLIGFTFHHLKAQTKISDYRFQSVFLYNFGKYIQWPAGNANGEFVIGVLGNDAEIYRNFQRMAGEKSLGARKITIKKVQHLKDVNDCQILFIASSHSDKAQPIIKKFADKNILIVTEKEGLAEKGSCINFVKINGKMLFEINKNATEKAGLKVPSNLLKLGIVV